MTSQKCAACNIKASQDSKYCLHHNQALQSMMKHYNTWVNAYSSISLKDFMNKISGMNETGSWIKEVIAVELKNKK